MEGSKSATIRKAFDKAGGTSKPDAAKAAAHKANEAMGNKGLESHTVRSMLSRWLSGKGRKAAKAAKKSPARQVKRPVRVAKKARPVRVAKKAAA